jgi:hypothetical protein
MHEVTCRPAAQTTPAAPTIENQLQTLIELLRRPEGASLNELMIATGWEAAWVRGAMFGALKARQKLTVLGQKTRAGRRYRMVSEATGGGPR